MFEDRVEFATSNSFQEFPAVSDAMLFSSWMMFYVLLITHAQQACAEWKEEMTSGMSSLLYCLHCIFTIRK